MDDTWLELEYAQAHTPAFGSWVGNVVLDVEVEVVALVVVVVVSW